MPRPRKRLLLALGLPAALALAVWWLLPLAFPLPSSLERTPASPVLLDRHGEPLHHLTLPDFTRSAPVALEEIPPDLVACTLAAEDKRFHSHGGVDLLATARAARDWAKSGRPVSGASTITQQLVKLTTPDSPRTLRTKAREALLARHLEMRWPKERILEAYLNRLNYGHNRIGPAEAARHYFQKPLADLSLGECALLAGLPQAPSRLDPVRHPDAALARRSTVLARLAASGKYDASRISTARTEPLNLRPLQSSPLAPWLPSFATASREHPAPATTIDASLQRDIERIVKEELAPLADANLHHAAVVVLDNATREILALVSSGDWHDPRGGQINGALTPRSPGSALKPFTYLLSFETAGRYPGSIVADIPTRFRTPEGLDLPQNYDRTYRGPVTIREALACSLNVPAMRELNSLGGPEPLQQLLVRLQVLEPSNLNLEPSYGLGLTLGNAPVTLLSLTNAYATLANGGAFQEPRLFKSPQSPHPQCPISQTSAFLITDILSDPSARAPAFGRHGPLELPFRCAAKTGTSSDFRDNWCLGYTAGFTVGVWAGNFDNSPMRGLSGVAGAGPIFRRTMLRLHRDTAPTWPAHPPGLVRIPIDPRTGRQSQVSPAHGSSVSELCPADSLPLPASPSDYDSRGRVLLDSSYDEWLASPDNRRRDRFAPTSALPAVDPLRILAPRPDITYLLDPELPNGGRLHLATNLPGLAEWSCETLKLLPGDPEPVALLTPGRHLLRATDPRTGSSTEVPLTIGTR